MAELLERIQSEIRERLAASREAVQEYERLQAALAALDGPEERAPAPRRRPAQAAAKSGRPRARRGANREAVLSAVADRPGASAGELATASGVSKPVLYNLLRTLSERGDLVRQELPGGGAGYALPGAEASAPDTGN
jgi:IclR-like helix-turn-helix domain-containing protein